MIRDLGPGDEPAVEAFLARHAATSMFLRSNLRAAGIVYRGELYQGNWVGAFDRDLVAVACHGWNGMILVQAPVRLTELVDAALTASGRDVDGLSGPWPQVEAARAHLGFTDRPAALDGAEDLFELSLADLVTPKPIHVRRAGPDDAEALTAWREAYDREILPGLDGYPERARSAVQSLIRKDHLFVAHQDGVPVAMSAFNAVLPDTVQIGGVWVPPSARRRGYGRAVVAGSLVTAREEGVSGAILFTDVGNIGAQAAYRALGFRVVGSYGVVLFR